MNISLQISLQGLHLLTLNAHVLSHVAIVRVLIFERHLSFPSFASLLRFPEKVGIHTWNIEHALRHLLSLLPVLLNCTTILLDGLGCFTQLI
jgi:hypothetical protein